MKFIAALFCKILVTVTAGFVLEIVFADTGADSSIASIWDRIEKVCKNQTPGIEFEPPATKDQIKKLEDDLNVTLPDDFKQSLQIHNGMISFINGWELLSTEGVYNEWKGWTRMLDDGSFDHIPQEDLNQNEAVAKCWWSKGWIPIAADGAGNGNCIDFNPGKTGTVGQIIDMDHEVGERDLLAKSYTEWLNNKASSLESGMASCNL